MSYRTDINQAIKTMLTGHTVAGNRVFTSLDRPLQPATDFPAIIVYTMEARRNDQDYGRTLISRCVKVGIECAVTGDKDTALPAVEAFADAVETAMDNDRTLRNVVTDSRWMATITDVTSNGETTIGVALIEYEIDIFTHLRDPETHDDGFDGVPAVVFSIPDTTAPKLFPDAPHSEDTACGPDGCDIPAWGGEVVK